MCRVKTHAIFNIQTPRPQVLAFFQFTYKLSSFWGLSSALFVSPTKLGSQCSSSMINLLVLRSVIRGLQNSVNFILSFDGF